MPPRSRALKTLLHSLVLQSKPEDGKQVPEHPNVPRRLSILETINQDVFRLIALELYHRTPHELKPLASCSRTLRNLASPILFSRCRRPYQWYPPYAIRPFARHLTYTGGQDVATSYGYCRNLLDSFPSLNSITFQEIRGLSWAVLRVCLSYPRINSISFANGAELTETDGFPIDDEASNISTSLGTFSYDVRLWRGKYYSQDRHIVPSYHRFQLAVTRESQCLRDLVPRMNNTLRQLSLPMESAPLLQMANVPWPNLRELSIGGQHWTSERVELLPTFLATLPSLDKLTVRICFEAEVTPGWERAPILGKQPTPRSVLSGMRSLTVAYPDPNDHIFLIDTSTLRHLSICDWPRHYNILQHRFRPPCGYPILSSAECLAVLQRMHLPELSSLELVYVADRAGSDDDLLQYVASKFCNLAHLELHRYRADREEDVDHIHIARLLTAARSLRTLHLNLDFRDDHGAYCGDYAVRREWWYKFRDTLGWEIVDVVQDACPLLGCVELLYHGHPTATWAEFHPSRCAEPRFVLSYDKDHREPDLMPYSWFDMSCRGPWTGHPERRVLPVQTTWQAVETSSGESSDSEYGSDEEPW